MMSKQSNRTAQKSLVQLKPLTRNERQIPGGNPALRPSVLKQVRQGGEDELITLIRKLGGAREATSAVYRLIEVALQCLLQKTDVGGRRATLPAAFLNNIALRLSARERQTLDLLKQGWAEKEIAAEMQLSRHTLHVYCKSIYRHFGVHSRGELMALWILTTDSTESSG